jgi:formylaminopyrimidine deformylase / aminopyrimidine aminohydrolase
VTASARGLAGRDPAAWAAATGHPFLDGAADGSLPVAAFDRWLEQDRLFVEALARAWGLVLAEAPVDDLRLLSEGIAAFVGEVAWFEELAADRGLAVPAEPLAATAAYNAHLLQMAGEPYPVALTAMWAVEAAYLEAWRSARPGAPAYRSFVEHWTDAAFAGFVDRLERAVDRALAGASAAEVDAAGRAVALTAGHEAAFWAMTLDA